MCFACCQNVPVLTYVAVAIKVNVRLHGSHKGEARAVLEIDFPVILALANSGLLDSGVEKAEIGITAQFADHLQLQLHRTRDKAFLCVGSIDCQVLNSRRQMRTHLFEMVKILIHPTNLGGQLGVGQRLLGG